MQPRDLRNALDELHELAVGIGRNLACVHAETKRRGWLPTYAARQLDVACDRLTRLTALIDQLEAELHERAIGNSADQPLVVPHKHQLQGGVL